MKTKIFITIDTEFSIAGAFSNPQRWKPLSKEVVECPLEGKSHGLGFLLETFARHSLHATFFVEALNTIYFGDEPMGDYAHKIAASGHDLQLHLHPCWTYFRRPNWQDTLRSDPPSDHFNGRSPELLKQWMNEGIDTFKRWGFNRPLALRTGSLITDAAVFAAMEDCGFTLSSNVALAAFWPKEPELQFYSGLHQIGKILEAPVLTYLDAQIGSRLHHHLLTVTGCSWFEIRNLLNHAHSQGVESIVLLTHPFEFIKYVAPDFTNLRPNPINQGRLEKLCAFLSQNRDRFDVCTFSQLANATPQALGKNAKLKAAAPAVAWRVFENALNR